jgi:hypothetical protein
VEGNKVFMALQELLDGDWPFDPVPDINSDWEE